MRLSAWALLASATLLYACSPSDGEIPGTYIADDGANHQVLLVKPDHTYESALYRVGKSVWKRRGQWIINDVDGEKRVSFENFRFGVFDAGRRGTGVGGFWPALPEKSLLGRVTFIVDPDLDRGFSKQ